MFDLEWTPAFAGVRGVSMARIAFIGLGHMGGGMAPNLVKAGHEVRAFDLSEEALSKACEQGCGRAGSTEEAVKDADVVITMLPAAKHVLDVYRNHVFGNAPASALLIDCSTIDVASARIVEEEASAKGYEMVDAPVSGGIAAAAAGTLAFMVGGSPQALAKAKPFIEPMAKAVIHAGGPGAGQAAKICNNMILGATMAVTCEGFVLAQKLGLDPKVFFDISSQASGQSWSMTSYCPVPGVGPKTPADNDYEGGFAAALMLKDLKLADEAAKSVGAYTPMGGEAEELFQRFVDRGGGNKDFSGIIKMIDDSWKVPDEH
jgi:3-hydroxyisobutyrate dehydrogenase